jgi:hypothetical protein
VQSWLCMLFIACRGPRRCFLPAVVHVMPH